MALPFGSEAWARALCEEINGSSEYRNAGASWGRGFNGNLLLSFEPGGALTAPAHLLLRLKEGRCEGAAFVPSADHPDAGFRLSAPFPLWREVLEGRTLAATAILTGRMKVDGNRIQLLSHAGSARALLHLVASMDTEFPSTP